MSHSRSIHCLCRCLSIIFCRIYGLASLCTCSRCPAGHRTLFAAHISTSGTCGISSTFRTIPCEFYITILVWKAIDIVKVCTTPLCTIYFCSKFKLNISFESTGYILCENICDGSFSCIELLTTTVTGHSAFQCHRIQICTRHNKTAVSKCMNMSKITTKGEKCDSI